MSDFWSNFSIGLRHLWNINAYIDILFLLVLTVPYEFKAWKRILILISLFTAGHALALLLSVFKVITVKSTIVGFIISVLILIIAFYNLFSAGKSGKKDSITLIAIVTSVFGLIHGLGFYNYFNHIILGKPTDKLLPVFESAFGFGIGQIIAVILALLLAYMVQTLLKFSKRDWILIVSSLVIGVLVPMVIQNRIWN